MISFKKLATKSAYSLGLMLAIGVAPAFAALDISGSNSTTGPKSFNENKTAIERKVKVLVKNLNEEKNYLDLWFNTGENDVEKNTKVGNVETGNVKASVNLSNTSNADVKKAHEAVLSKFEVSDPNLSNHLTGPYSKNINKVYVDTYKELTAINEAYVKNDLDLKANTGKNDFYKNTVVGDVKTGNIELKANVNTVANANQCVTCPDALKLFNETGMPDVQSNLSNHITGPDSVNINEAKIEDTAKLTLVNKAYINNDVDVHANTGYNDIAKNTVVGNVKTGDVAVDLTVANTAN